MKGLRRAVGTAKVSDRKHVGRDAHTEGHTDRIIAET